MADWEAIEAEYHRRAKEAQAELAAWLVAALNEDEVPPSRAAVLENRIYLAIDYLTEAIGYLENTDLGAARRSLRKALVALGAER